MKNNILKSVLMTFIFFTKGIAIADTPLSPLDMDGKLATTLTHSHRLSMANFAYAIDRFLSTTKLKLNNHHSQTSFVEVSGLRFDFAIPRTVVDIDCGTFCPDLGDGHFYLNDINLTNADFKVRIPTLIGNPGFLLKMGFEDSGREIKGYHNKLGDNGMPDFEMRGISLSVSSQIRLVGNELGLTFGGAHLSADIQSTGGCNLAGVDLCNKIFGTDRKIQKSVEAAAVQSLNSGAVQYAIRLGIKQYLRSVGIDRAIVGVRLEGTDIIITTM